MNSYQTSDTIRCPLARTEATAEFCRAGEGRRGACGEEGRWDGKRRDNSYVSGSFYTFFFLQPHLYRLFSALASLSSLAGDTGTLEDLRDYARRLLASFPDDPSEESQIPKGSNNAGSGLGITLPAGLESDGSAPSFLIPPTRDEIGEGVGDGEERRGSEEEREKEEERRRRLLQREMEWAEKEDREGGGGFTGCREAVEILTRTSKKGRFFV